MLKINPSSLVCWVPDGIGVKLSVQLFEAHPINIDINKMRHILNFS